MILKDLLKVIHGYDDIQIVYKDKMFSGKKSEFKNYKDKNELINCEVKEIELGDCLLSIMLKEKKNG